MFLQRLFTYVLRLIGKNRLRNKGSALALVAKSGWTPDLIVDVGAGLGTPGLCDAWPHVPAFLIEPNPRSAATLKRHNRTTDLVFEARAGSAEEPGMVTIDGTVLQSGSRVEAILIKIDVDGPETDVLAGGQATLENHDCVVVIECVLHDRDRGRLLDIFNFLRAAGYELLDIIEPMYRSSDQVLWQVDCIFVRAGSPLRGDRSYGPALS